MLLELNMNDTINEVVADELKKVRRVNAKLFVALKTRYLTKKVRRAVIELDPKQIDFKVKKPVVECEITDARGNIGIGISFCSELDDFDTNYGKSKAAGRAVKGLLNRCSSDPIRGDWDSYPDSWTKRRIERLQWYSNMYPFKVEFIKIDDQDESELEWLDVIDKRLSNGGFDLKPLDRKEKKK